jgi:hypothetical protein
MTIPNPRPKNQKYLHISVYPLHRDLVYLFPTVMIDMKPINGDKFHARICLFVWIIQVEVIRSKRGLAA